MKPNWSCTICGMYSGRRYSVQRHIRVRHAGAGSVIPFVEYLAGRRSGYYPPGPRPSFGPKAKSIQDEIEEEAKKVYIRRVAEQCYPPSGHPSYADSVEYYKSCINIINKPAHENS